MQAQEQSLTQGPRDVGTRAADLLVGPITPQRCPANVCSGPQSDVVLPSTPLRTSPNNVPHFSLRAPSDPTLSDCAHTPKPSACSSLANQPIDATEPPTEPPTSVRNNPPKAPSPSLPAMPAAPADSFALDKSNPVLALSAAVGGLYVHRFPAGTPVPPELFSNVDAADDFVSVTRVGNELSIVATKGATSNVGMPEPSAEHCGGPWTAMKVKGPLEHRECAGRWLVLLDHAGGRCTPAVL